MRCDRGEEKNCIVLYVWCIEDRRAMFLSRFLVYVMFVMLAVSIVDAVLYDISGLREIMNE